MIGIILLLLALLAAVLLWGSSKEAKGSIASALQGSGTTPRGPVRLNISDNAYNRKHAALGTGLTLDKVRRSPHHVAYMYHEQLAVEWQNQPAVVIGFKDHALAGKSQVDYGHIITKDGKYVVAFESLAPAIVDGNTSTITVRLTGLKGTTETRVSKLFFTVDPEEKVKKVRFAVL
jgi:hypothetical protein